VSPEQAARTNDQARTMRFMATRLPGSDARWPAIVVTGGYTA
jgi:hypothetical protein